MANKKRTKRTPKQEESLATAMRTRATVSAEQNRRAATGSTKEETFQTAKKFRAATPEQQEKAGLPAPVRERIGQMGEQAEAGRRVREGLPTVEEEQAKITEAEQLRGKSSMEELKEQILNPDLSLREVGVGDFEITPFGRSSAGGGEFTEKRAFEPGAEGAISGVEQPKIAKTLKLGGSDIDIPEEQYSIYKGKRQMKGLITTQIDKDTSVVSAEAQMLFTQIVSKTAKVSGGGIIDQRLANMEGALINHKESSAQVIQALQRGAYTPQEAIERLELMVNDCNVVEETMQLLSIHSPAVYAEMRGWEYTTRLQKIRESILTNEQGVINFVETGQIIPDEAGALALQLNELKTK